jgi:hypothetical protein
MGKECGTQNSSQQSTQNKNESGAAIAGCAALYFSALIG